MRICQPPENCSRRPIAIASAKPQPVQHAADLGLDAVAAAPFELLLQLGVLVHQRVEVSPSACSIWRSIDAHLFLDAQQVGDGAQDFVVQRAAGLHAGVLGQVADHRRRAAA